MYLIALLVVLPIIWIAVGGFATGMIDQMDAGDIPVGLKFMMIVAAPITLLFLLAVLAYNYGFKARR